MKKFFTLLLLLCLFPFAQVHSQEKLPFVDTEKILSLSRKEGAEGNYTKALELLENINKNDSLYCSTLVSRSYFQLNLEQYPEALETAEEGLQKGCPDDLLSLMINKGVAFLNMEKNEEALSVFNKALDIFPRNSQLWYNMGNLMEARNNIPEAVSAYQNAVLFNPSYAKPHLRLGDICYKQELTTQALMSYNTFLLLNPEGEEAFRVLQALNELVKIKNPNKARNELVISPDEARFEELNLILDNRIALNDQYQVDSEILLPLTKQNHLMMEQLSAEHTGKGFWSGVYTPLYQWIWKNGLFEDFTYTISYSAKNESFKKVLSKNLGEVKEFWGLFSKEWISILENNSFRVLESDQGKTYSYHNFQIDGLGFLKNEQPQGEWVFFREDGSISAKGELDRNSKKTGEWTWYTKEGTITEKGVYKNGLAEGRYETFYKNGKPKFIAHYEKDQLSGEYRLYNEEGALIEIKNFDAGVLDGPYTSNFVVGESLPEFKLSYKKGQVDGRLLENYADGTLYAEKTYKDGKQHGMEKTFNRDGSLNYEVNYKKGVPTGTYTAYHLNGAIKETSNYQEGQLQGPFVTYYEDGTRESEGAWEKGRLDGKYSYYDHDGKLYYEYDYRKGELIGFRFFDKSGKLIDEGRKKGGEFYYKGYSPYGILTSEGQYDITGGKNGSWKYYTSTGLLKDKGNYKENLANGPYTTYYPNGQVQSSATYEKDTLQGYWVDYFQNGQMKSQGWYEDGMAQGAWSTYFANGQPEKINFYHKGDLHGVQKTFGVEGKLVSLQEYEFGNPVEDIFFNEQQEPYTSINYRDYPKGEYQLVKKHFNGQKGTVANFVNTIKHGEYLKYDFRGNLVSKGTYLNGEEHGPWTLYYPDGTIKQELSYSGGSFNGEYKEYYENGKLENAFHYQYGVPHGTWKSFYENGQLDVLTQHKAGEQHGRKEFYSPSGQLQLIRFYDMGRLIGYSHLDSEGKKLPMIPLKNETGKLVAYYDNGKVSRAMEYDHGALTGNYNTFYYTGEKESELEYESGDYSGNVKEYYKNGNLKTHNTYLAGLLHGFSREYYRNGQVKKETPYINNIKHGEENEYDQEGNVTRKTRYHNGEVYSLEVL